MNRPDFTAGSFHIKKLIKKQQKITFFLDIIEREVNSKITLKK
jgi:hypothetical protein